MIVIGIIGDSEASEEEYKFAYILGAELAKRGFVIISGGRTGVMEAVSKGAKSAGGLTLAILPSADKSEANPYIYIKLSTGIGFARNYVIVNSSDLLIAIGYGYGTLSEIAFALNEGKRVYGIDTWDIKGIIKVKTPQEAIKRIKKDFRL